MTDAKPNALVGDDDLILELEVLGDEQVQLDESLERNKGRNRNKGRRYGNLP